MKRLVLVFLFFSLIVTSSLAQEILNLNKSIRIALEQSPVIHKVKAEIIAAEGAAGQAVAGFLPQLSLSASAGKYYSEPQTMEIDMTGTGSPTAITFGTDEQADTTNYSASLTQPLFTGGKLWSSVAMANKGLAVAKEELRKIAIEVEFNVINAYYSVIKAQKMVELGEESVEMAKNHLNQVNALLKVGMSTRADVLRGEVQAAQAEIGLTKAKQALELAKNNFNNTLGRDLDDPVSLIQVGAETGMVRIYPYKELLAVAYHKRPDWKQYVLVKKVSEDEVALARSGLWPMISVVGNYDTGSTRYSSYQTNVKNWTAILSGTWNIFDGTATWNKIKEAEAKLEAQKADEINVKRGIALEVKDANFVVKSSIENLQSTEKAVELATENHNIAEERYKAGVGTNLEEIDAQVALTQAKTDHLQAQHDLLIAKAKLNKIIGKKIY